MVSSTLTHQPDREAVLPETCRGQGRRSVRGHDTIVGASVSRSTMKAGDQTQPPWQTERGSPLSTDDTQHSTTRTHQEQHS